VLSCLDYGKTVLFGLPQQLVERLQSVQNAVPRWVLAARRRDHISPLLQSLHWLQVVEQITFRLAVITVEHPTTCQDNSSESLMFAHVSNSAPHRPLHSSFR